VVAGRIRDCTHINQVMNGTVGSTVSAVKLVYFNGEEGEINSEGKEKSSNPDPYRRSTNTDGLYAFMDLIPGDVTISSVAKMAGVDQSFGTLTAKIIADSVTVLSFKGVRLEKK
jgi:hypothetical protein